MRHILTFLVGVFLLSSGFKAHAGTLVQRDPEIRSAVAAYIQQKTAQLGYEVHIRKLAMSGPTELPEGIIDFEVLAPQQWEGWGKASITVYARQGNRVVRNISVQVDVEALAEMVIPVHQIDHGSIISEGDVVLKKWDVSGLQGKYMGKVGDAVGKKARNTLRPNTPIKPDQLERIALIKSGQAVTILAENGNMRITVIGKAKSAGAEGDTISVQNMMSLKEFPARVIDANTVMVVF
jgi:flagella basal body P-ring formation protein FlgA